ncbi:MAG: oligosaccharide flippase family protein [Ferruginibacter sp.]
MSVIQHDPLPQPKQQLLGAAFKLFKYSVLISLLFCFIALFTAPFLFSDNLTEISNIRLAIVVGTFGVIVEQFGGIAGNALRGNNLDYKGLGIRSIIIILSNSVIVLLVLLKFGIVGLALASFTGSVAFCILWFLLAKRELPWFKQLKVSSEELKLYARQSALTLGHSLGNYLLTNMDAVLIGIIMGSKYAAMYFISVTIFRTFFFPLISTLNSSSGAGLAFLFGSENWGSAKEVILQLTKVSLILCGAAGFFYILFNREIVHFWVGDSFYSNERLEYYFVIFCILQSIYSLMHYLIDGLQMFKIKARISGMLGFFFILLAIPLLYLFNLKGLLIAASITRLAGIFFLVKRINNKVPYLISVALLIKQFLIIAIILFITYYLASLLPILSLMQFIGFAGLSAFFLTIGAYILIPVAFKQRIISNLPFFKKQ